MQAPLTRRPPYLALVVALVLITLGQVLRPGVNQDVRYVVGALETAGAAGLGWTEVWAHRPMTARAVVALVDAVSPGRFATQEIAIRAWCVLLAVAAGLLLWRGLRGRCTPRVAAWTAVGAGAALAWAPGWDFAEPEWFAAALAVAAVGAALWPTGPHASAGDSGGAGSGGAGSGGTDAAGEATRWPTVVAGVLLALVVGLKFTTAATALAALIVITALDRWRGFRAACATALAAPALIALTVLIEPREWQWLLDMPTLNPGLSAGGLAEVGEGLVNALVVSPVVLVGLVAIGWLFVRRGRERSAGVVALVVLVILATPFVVQQQNFLYHLAALPVAAAAFAGAVAARAERIPVALPVTGVLGLVVGAGLFAAMGPRTRSQNLWVAAVAVAAVAVLGLGLLAIRRGPAGAGPLALVLVAATCLAPLLVPVSPRTAYSFSLAHNRVTAADNFGQAVGAPARLAEVRRVLPADESVVYLSFSAPYWLGNPTPCAYVSPTFLQRSAGPGGERVAATRSYAENLACLDDPLVGAIVIEPAWFTAGRVRHDIRAAFNENFDCGGRVEVDGWVICPRR